MDVRQRTEEIEHMTFAPWATFSDQSRGRMLPEEQDPIRPVFQRDRDRVLHCKAFRRLKQKTQVFLSPEGDLYRTRLTELRINAAKELLTDPFRSAAEVASMVGYEDASYFARAFKKRTGMTPTQYRKEAAKAAREARL